MKRTYFLIFCLFAGFLTGLQAQDTLYVMKKGSIDFRHALSDIDSLSFINSFNPGLVERLAKDKRFSLFNQALSETGYADLINNTPKQDTAYDYRDCPWAIRTYNIEEEIPQKRWFSYTLLMESDSTLTNYKACPLCPNGISNLNDLELLAKYWYSTAYQGMYSDGEGITDRKAPNNYLNRYIAYHILDSKLFLSRFINDFDIPNQIKTFNLDEYKGPLLNNSLLQVKKARTPAQTNLLNSYDANDLNAAVRFTGATLFGYNGFAFGVDKPLVFSRKVYEYLSSIRLRMDVASFFKEFASNNMRGDNPKAENVVGKAHRYIIPPGYCDNMSFTSATRMSYLGANGIYEAYEGDEFYVEGKYDFTVTTLPIPAGTYEVRFGYQPTSWRGLDQMYFDGVTCGPPVKFYLLANDPLIGWELPGSKVNDPNGFANDSLLRTRGYMKGPSSYKCTIPLYYDVTKTARTSIKSLRKIVGTFTFAGPGKHTLRIQNTGSSGGDVQFMLDYLEFVPVSILKNEGVD